MNHLPLHPVQITYVSLHTMGQRPLTHPHLIFEVDLQKWVNIIQPVFGWVIWSDIEGIEGVPA
jgi:hypothetical protein